MGLSHLKVCSFDFNFLIKVSSSSKDLFTPTWFFLNYKAALPVHICAFIMSHFTRRYICILEHKKTWNSKWGWNQQNYQIFQDIESIIVLMQCTCSSDIENLSEKFQLLSLIYTLEDIHCF